MHLAFIPEDRFVLCAIDLIEFSFPKQTKCNCKSCDNMLPIVIYVIDKSRANVCKHYDHGHICNASYWIFSLCRNCNRTQKVDRGRTGISFVFCNNHSIIIVEGIIL